MALRGAATTRAATETIPPVTDILEHARASVLETGSQGLRQALPRPSGCSTLTRRTIGEPWLWPDEVRIALVRPEVEVEGDRQRRK